MTSALHPDAALLELCRRLGEQQAEWQRLYDLTSDRGPISSEADFEWTHYGAFVWPCTQPEHPHRAPGPDLPAQLCTARATTPEGKAAKAAAILALDDASKWTECRDDIFELIRSLLEDVAGAASTGLGASP